MKIITPVLAALAAAGLMLFVFSGRLTPLSRACALKELAAEQSAVTKEIQDISARLVVQSREFCSTVSQDMDFAMKLIVEKDVSAPAVSDIAGRYLKPMGFDFLEITDAGYRILSCGHFPASAGNTLTHKSSMPDAVGACVYENVRGKNVLSLQVKIPFTCEGQKLYCFGGIAVDSSFVSRIRLFPEMSIFIKQDKEIIGMEDIRTMSEIKDNTMVINDKKWLAASVPLPLADEAEKPEIIILKNETGGLSLLDLI